MVLDNIASVLSSFVKSLNIPITRQSILDELERHPDHSSLLAISDLLNNWRVPNAAYKLAHDELLSTEIPVPFIVYFSSKEFVVIHEINDRGAIVSNNRWDRHVLPTDEFKKFYTGAILIAEKADTSGEVDYAKKQAKQRLNDARLPGVILTSSVILLIFLFLKPGYLASINLQIGLLALFKTIGLITAILLLLQSIDTDNPLIQKLCGGDRNKNCNAVLSTKAAKITENISWSEVGFFYFTGTWIEILFNGDNLSILQLLAIINLLSLPYSLFSIYYQWRIAKQWCILCCTVQGLLWLEFFTFLPTLTQTIQVPQVREGVTFIMCMAIPIIAWIFIKPYLLLSKQIGPLKSQLRKFKYNSELFQILVKEGVKYALPTEEHSLIIGNREAENIITMVSNPFCKPCAKAHKGLEWLNERSDVKLQIVFFTDNTDNDPKTKVASHLLSLQQNRDDKSLKKALDDWYDQKQKNIDAWAKEYPVTANFSATDTLTINQEWCKLAEVSGTPTLFINGRKLPENYQPEDLKYFL